MKYKITIEQIDIQETTESVFCSPDRLRKLGLEDKIVREEPSRYDDRSDVDKDGKVEKGAYVRLPKQEEKSETIYEQTRETAIDLMGVINAFNRSVGES